jgi:hypothetical protein
VPAVARNVAAACLALPQFACGDRGATGAVLTVDDPDSVGAVGDGRLSFSEAIELASGTLSLDALDRTERAAVDGAPGARSADSIRFAPGLRVTVRRRAERVASVLPPLTGARDEIDGTGATIDGSLLGNEPQASSTETSWISDAEVRARSIAPLLVTAATGVRVHHLAVQSFPGAALVVTAPPGGAAAGIRIFANTVDGLGRDGFSDGIVVIAGANAAPSRLGDVAIEENTLRDVHAGILVSAGSAFGAGRSVRGCRVDGVAIARNRIQRPLTGILAFAGQASLDASTEENALVDLDVIDNVVEAPLDVGILASTTQPLASGRTARNRIERARFAGNVITAPRDLARSNTGFFLTGGEVLVGGESFGDLFAELTLEDNTVSGLATGMLLVAGDAERCGPCRVERSTIDGVVLRRHTWDVRQTGLLVAAGSSFETAGTTAGNRLRDVRFEDEDITAGRVGVVLAGALASSLPLGGDFLAGSIEFPGHRRPADLLDNRFLGVSLRSSAIRAQVAVSVQGCSVNETEDVARSSGIEQLVLEDNVIAESSSPITVLGGVVVARGRAEDCEVRSLVEAGNRSDVGTPIAAIVAPEAAVEGAPPDSVRGNRVVW